VHGVELCNGFGELVDPQEQRARFEHDRAARAARGLPVYPIDEKLLDALGALPPSAGNALGLDRLCALAAGTRDIARVMAFTTDEL
jgi:lysyl-tRNA synthetase class 2